MVEGTKTTTTKKYAVTIGSKCWHYGMLANISSIVYVFQPAGLWTFCFPAMQIRLNFIKDDGISAYDPNLTWMRCRETFWMKVLLLSQSIFKHPQMSWMVDVKNQLLSCEQFIQIVHDFLVQLVTMSMYQTSYLCPVATLMTWHKMLFTKFSSSDWRLWWMLSFITCSIDKEVECIFELYW